MAFCPGETILCNDNTCYLHLKHYTCIGHMFHLGDRVKNISRNKFGYIYDINPLSSKRSMVIKYDDDNMEKIFGFKTCTSIEKVNDPRDLSRINPKYQ